MSPQLQLDIFLHFNLQIVRKIHFGKCFIQYYNVLASYKIVYQGLYHIRWKQSYMNCDSNELDRNTKFLWYRFVRDEEIVKGRVRKHRDTR